MDVYSQAIDVRKLISKRTCCYMGDCAELSYSLATEISGRVCGGVFMYTPQLWACHVWVDSQGHVLDPSIDQFENEWGIKLSLKTPGIYFSHPAFDGAKLRHCYHEYTDPENEEEFFWKISQDKDFDIERFLSDPNWFKNECI